MQEIRTGADGRRDDEISQVRSMAQVEQAMVRVGNRQVRLHPPGTSFDAWHKGKRYRYRVDEAGNLWQVVPGPEHRVYP